MNASAQTNAPRTIAAYIVPRGFGFVQYELDEQNGHATFTYEAPDGRTAECVVDESTPGIGDPHRKEWAARILGRRTRDEMIADGLFTNLRANPRA